MPFSWNLARVSPVKINPRTDRGVRGQRLLQALMACSVDAWRRRKLGTAGRFFAQYLQPESD
eukprot:6212352-Pleurochrysis_carterae.AAC.2